MSIRRLMAVVVGFALLLGLAPPAAEVYRAEETHTHGYVGRGMNAGAWAAREDEVSQPFWPRYRLRLLGRPWKRVSACLAGKGRLQEACSIEEPDCFTRTCFSSQVYFRPTIDAMRAIRKLNGLKPDPRLEALVQHP